MNMAQSRALNQRFQLFLPPPEDPAAIHSALTQVIEALAADMIEPSRARALISGLRLCLQSLKKKDSWHDSAYHCDEPVEYENFDAEYGLPKDIDLAASPESAFPPTAKDVGAPSFREAKGWDSVGAPPFSPAFGERVGTDHQPLATDHSLLAEAQRIIDVSRGLPPSREDKTCFISYVTPLDAEMMEVMRTEGQSAAMKIQDQFERNEQRRVHRRQSSADRERFALISMQRNLQAAIERHAKRLVESAAAPKKPAASDSATDENLSLTPTASIG
jgi:hypothetical protein